MNDQLTQELVQQIVSLYESGKMENDRFKIIDYSFGRYCITAEDKTDGNVYMLHCDFDHEDTLDNIVLIEVFDFKRKSYYAVDGIFVSRVW